jgi:protein-tyrosine-phosphatase
MKTTITSFLCLVILLFGNPIHSQTLPIEINKELETTTERLIANFDEIDAKRKKELEELGDFMVEQLKGQEKFNALFVCTHNSRRSHIADLWFKYGMYYYGVNQFESFSGGTEATAFNPKAIEAIKRAGFTVVYDKKVENPVVSITPKNYPVWRMKSKVYSHEVNPKSNFVAVMVCSDADKSCPAVDGAVGRFAIPYNDPRYFDNTPSEKQKYDETVALIGTEMLYLVHHIKNKIIVQAELEK